MPIHPIPEFDALIQSATVLKQAKTIKFTFATPFKAPPLVFVQAYYRETGTSVAIETVTDISATGCAITSNNGSPASTNYFVCILAVDSGLTAFGALPLALGNLPKTKPAATLNLPTQRLGAPDPALLLTPYWQGSTEPSGQIETVLTSSPTECSVFGGSAAKNYSANFLAADPGIGKVGPRRMMAGVANKTGGGVLRVYFPQPFKTVPSVFLTPWYDNYNAAMGSLETLNMVCNDYFETVSGHAAANYFVNWVAVA